MKQLLPLIFLLFVAACSDAAPYHVDARARGGHGIEGQDVVPGGPNDTIGGGVPSLNHWLHCHAKNSSCPDED